MNRRQVLQLLGLGPMTPMLPPATPTTLVQPVADWSCGGDPLSDIRKLIADIERATAAIYRLPVSFLRGEGPPR